MNNVFRIFKGMAWPTPSDTLTELAWSLRHQQRGHIFTMEERLVAAAVLSAYADLVWKPTDRRNAIIRELRKGPLDTRLSAAAEAEGKS
jgi:hypothetical protein